MSANITKIIKALCRKMKAIHAYRRTVYLIFFVGLIILIVSSYGLHKTNVENSAPVHERYLVSVMHGLDFSKTFQNRTIEFRPLPIAHEDGFSGIFGWSFFGKYNHWTGEMVLADILLQEENQNTRILTTRHEVGHALFEDIVATNFDDGFLGYLQTMFVVNSAKFATRDINFLMYLYPENIRQLYYIYINSAPPIGSDESLADANLNEFFAETYTNMLTGLPVPDQFVDFLEPFAYQTDIKQPKAYIF